MPTSSGTPFRSRKTGPPASPLHRSVAPVSSASEPAVAAVNAVTRGRSGTQSFPVRPKPAAFTVSFDVSPVPSAIGATGAGTSSRATARSRAGCLLTCTAFVV